ncbi:MAG TPA: hypothetical protein VJT33_09225, partial [bacterium]|nr:hypothetical protein [bacterium]
PARPGAAALAAAAFGGLTALPSLAWIASGWLAFSASSGFTKRFFFRDWDLRGIVKALSEIPLAVEAHLFVAVFLLLLVGIPAAVRRRARLREVWVWCTPWIVLYVVAPWDSLVNRYYDLPATYLLTVVAAIGLWAWSAGGARPARVGTGAPRAFVTALVVVLGVTVAYDVWDPTTDRIARASTRHAAPIDPVPFYSARIVAALPPGRTIADTPQTMFYAGGDPAWIEITGGDVRWKIDGEEYDYVVLNDYGHGQEPYYPVDAALRAQLRSHHYVQIAPGAWAHVRTRVGDLGGYRAAPLWAPALHWRRPAVTSWQ